MVKLLNAGTNTTANSAHAYQVTRQTKMPTQRGTLELQPGHSLGPFRVSFPKVNVAWDQFMLLTHLLLFLRDGTIPSVKVGWGTELGSGPSRKVKFGSAMGCNLRRASVVEREQACKKADVRESKLAGQQTHETANSRGFNPASFRNEIQAESLPPGCLGYNPPSVRNKILATSLPLRHPGYNSDAVGNRILPTSLPPRCLGYHPACVTNRILVISLPFHAAQVLSLPLPGTGSWLYPCLLGTKVNQGTTLP
ncbi:hypothetical protein BT69DRAFT_1304947 [Atractiella rhizophila]|nr:hypothetical protein BT69DRAFT_1304947 [Atractiella rhizophila]